jgi:hypothetical protein
LAQFFVIFAVKLLKTINEYHYISINNTGSDGHALDFGSTYLQYGRAYRTTEELSPSELHLDRLSGKRA